MKTIALLTAVMLVSVPAQAAPADDLRQDRRARRSAIDLFRAGTPDAAVALLRQQTRPEPGIGGDQLSLPQNLIEIALEFYNRREMSLAREATMRAHLAAEPILAGRTAVTAQRRAQLYASLGVLYESVLFDLGTALRCYDAAVALHPADTFSRSRQNAATEKQQRRPGGGR